MTLIRNAAKCTKCGDTIESKHVHDWVTCLCKAIFVDGGLEYLRRGYVHEDDIIELSEYAPELSVVEEPSNDRISQPPSIEED